MKRKNITIKREELKEPFNITDDEKESIPSQDLYPLLIQYLLQLYLKQRGEKQ